jgi:predicted enzyme related to lactoylglutathione lyase
LPESNLTGTGKTNGNLSRVRKSNQAEPPVSQQDLQKPGTIAWRDLTVPNAEQVKDFYCQVVGWKATPHEMGDYHDYNIHSSQGDEPIAGICHARGSNANVPPQWLMYIIVENVERSARKCVELGGKVLDGPRKMGAGDFAVIQDPAGAVCALFHAGVGG